MACEAWSGDIIQLQFDNPDIKFVRAGGGPGAVERQHAGARTRPTHKANAEELMNYYYEPEVAATLAAWVNYICPVEGARQAMEKIDSSLVDNELIFPDEETLSKAPRTSWAWTRRHEQDYQKQFAAVIGADLTADGPTGVDRTPAPTCTLQLGDQEVRRASPRSTTSTWSSEQGSFFALLGPSGCGKTTTLRMVAGLEEPTSGTITIGGQDISRLKPYKRPVNTVFQNYALFPHLDIFENVAFGLRRRGVKDVEEAGRRDARAGRARAASASAGPAQLSGGQQQRVALARALINRPQVLLLDEPLGALDLKLRRQMQIELKRIQTEVGITFVHVTHDQEEAMTMADTIAVMNQGVIEQMGAPGRALRLPGDHVRRPTSSASPTW